MPEKAARKQRNEAPTVPEALGEPSDAECAFRQWLTKPEIRSKIQAMYGGST
jgi:hypothetical protein